MNPLDQRVWTAQADAWQAQGRLRELLGGGAVERPGIRLMASGLPHAQWNNGDVTDPDRVPWQEVRAWFATRAGGAGVPWGVRVPAGMALGRGRFVFRNRCMALVRAEFRPADPPAGTTIRVATARDADTVARIDAAAFGDHLDSVRRWVEPHLGAPGFTVALAESGGHAVGAATAIVTDDRAGACVGIFGVGVLDHARRRGIGAALTVWLLRRSFDEGAEFAHLNPNTEAAARLYARLGFVETAGLDVYAEL
jgi:ribosomal protein S18 acetylase RimI-like enzyme